MLRTICDDLTRPVGVALDNDKVVVSCASGPPLLTFPFDGRGGPTPFARGAPLAAPGGLCIAGQRLFAAVPGTHSVVAVDLASGKSDVVAGGRRGADATAPRMLLILSSS